MRDWQKAPGCEEKAWDKPDACRAERRFVATIRDPEGQLYSMTSELLARLEDVTPNAPSRAAARGLLFLHGSVGDRHRRGVDLGPSSLPVNMNWKERLVYPFLPSSFGLTPATAGYGEVGWEVRRHLTWDKWWVVPPSSSFAISFPLRYRPRSDIGRDDLGMVRDLLVPGVRLEYKEVPGPRGWGKYRVGVQADGWFRTKPLLHSGWLEDWDPDRTGWVGHTLGLYVSVFDKLTFTLTGVPEDLRVFRRDDAWRPFGLPNPLIATIAVSDLNGLLYWGLKLF